ncbi:hypothetical protein G6F24_018528 [Rhizopus arrhizus]|nr:hypothetical protein G6F24_018528 [Rhizopus arrhizus]
MKPAFVNLNVATRLNLITVVAACHGGARAKFVRAEHRAPPADDPVLGAGHECPSGNASWPRVLAVERADHLPIDRGRLRGTPPDGRGRGTAG